MLPETPNIDPTDPICVHSAREQIDDQEIRNVFETVEDAFSSQLSHVVTAQILRDIRTMADIRFRGLFDRSRVTLQETVEKFEHAQTTPSDHSISSESVLPGWELTIGIKLNEGMLVDGGRIQQRVKPDKGPIQAAMELSTERPIVDSAHVAALYHHQQYTQPAEDRDVVCSYLADDFPSFDYCLLITADDIDYLLEEPISEVETNDYRGVIDEVLEQKLKVMMSASTPHQVQQLFEGYAKPLIIRVQDFIDIHGSGGVSASAFSDGQN